VSLRWTTVGAGAIIALLATCESTDTRLGAYAWVKNGYHCSGGMLETWGMITKINPGELHTPPGYHHVTIVEAGRTAYLAGQCPVGPDGRVVGTGNLGAQIDQLVANSMVALGAAGASPEDVIRTVIYVVSDQRDVLGAAWDRLRDSELGTAFTTASTLVGVAQLGFPGQLIEVDLTAAL